MLQLLSDVWFNMNVREIETRKRLLIISPDVVGANMAGPGMRYWELARVLADDVGVTLAVPGEMAGSQPEGFGLGTYQFDNPALLRTLVDSSDVLLIASYLVYRFPFLKQVEQPVVVDIYIPFILENLDIHSGRPVSERMGIHNADLTVMNQLMSAGDFFLCASEKQRDLWLGVLAANNRVNPLTYSDDPTLRRLIDVVPVGLPATPPVHTRQVLKGVYPGIGATDKVILWGGGIWEWFDPLTLIRAMARIVAERRDVKLFFMGTRHPNPVVPDMQMVVQARELAQDLGLLDQHVFFNDWVAYQERQNYLLEADVGASLHFDRIETSFSFRTRLLDYIWAGLPMIVTSGDSLSELVADEGLGTVVPPGDVGAVTQCLRVLLSQPDLRAAYRERFKKVASRLTWRQVAEPLRAFVCAPWHAPDCARNDLLYKGISGIHPVATSPHLTPWWALPGKALRIITAHGPRALAAEVHSYVNWFRSRSTG
jgi:glycosyltransferase involved in cell wall biosynthesis